MGGFNKCYNLDVWIIPLLFITDHTSIIALSIILFLRGCSIGALI